jgi:hypothetical protein
LVVIWLRASELVPTAASSALLAVVWLRASELVPTAASWGLLAVVWFRASELVPIAASWIEEVFDEDLGRGTDSLWRGEGATQP